jgi:DNA-directed RNA polymerase specialized sigma24 family protein
MARDWSISPGTWEQLLTLLDSDRDRAAEQYELLHRKLVRFFEYRGAASPPDAADLTLDRVMRKMEAGEQIKDVGNYTYAVARLVLLESARQASRFTAAEEAQFVDITTKSSDSGRDRMRGCFDECVHGMPAGEQHLILEYYSEDRSAKIEGRRLLAEKLAIPLAALRLRAHRIRTRLESCIGGCMERQAG